MTKYYRDLDRVAKALDNLLTHHEPRLSVGMIQAMTLVANFIQWEFEELKVQESLNKSLEEISGE